jgi:hypothetical protein
MATQINETVPEVTKHYKEPFSLRRFARTNSAQLGIFGVFLVLWIIFIIAAPTTFLSKQIYYAFMSTIPFFAIMAIPLTIVVIAKEIGELPGKRFAVIVDEAHSSQSGESTKSLKSVLASGSLEEAEQEDGQVNLEETPRPQVPSRRFHGPPIVTYKIKLPASLGGLRRFIGSATIAILG